MAYCVVRKIYCQVRIFSLPRKSSVCIPYLCRRTSCFSHLSNCAQAFQLIANCFKMLMYVISGEVNMDQSIAVVADRPVLGVLNLSEHNDGSDYERDRHCKLQYNQHLPWERCQTSNAKRSFEHF